MAHFDDNKLADAYRKIWTYRLLRRALLPILGVDRFCDIGWLTRRAAATAGAWDYVDANAKGSE